MSEPKKLDHLEEYKTIRAELTLYQQEMHRTWLWAIIPATAVYTWLASHPNDLGAVRKGVWFCPVILIVVGCMRYFGFWCRVERLIAYQCDIEEAAFDKKPEQTEEKEHMPESWKLRGIARWNEYHPGMAWPKGCIPIISMWLTIIIWASMVGLSCWLSCQLSGCDSTHQRATQSPQANSNAPLSQPTNIQPASGTQTSTGAPPSQPISR